MESYIDRRGRSHQHISEVRRMLIICCHCCVVSCHCCAHTLLTFCFVDPRLLAFRTKAPAEAGAAAADLAARLVMADIRCAPSCTCPLSQRLFYRCLFYRCLAPLVDCHLRTSHLPSSHLPHCWCLQSRGERRSSNRGYDDRRDRPHRPSQVHSFELLPALFLPQAAR
jgi:hypothetical protein